MKGTRSVLILDILLFFIINSNIQWDIIYTPTSIKSLRIEKLEHLCSNCFENESSPSSSRAGVFIIIRLSSHIAMYS